MKPIKQTIYLPVKDGDSEISVSYWERDTHIVDVKEKSGYFFTPEHLWVDYDKSKEWQDAQVHIEKTGYECAKWLVDYCIKNGLKCPDYYCHSMNPVGKDKIVGLLGSFSNNH